MTIPSIVQSVFAGGDGDATIAAAIAAAGAGRQIAVMCLANSVAAAVTGITDDQGNTYAKRVEIHTQRTAEIWTAENITGGVTSVTVTWNTNIASATAGGIIVNEIQDAATTSSSAGTSSGSGSETDTAIDLAVTGFTPSENNTLVLAAAWISANASSWTAGADYTLDENAGRYAQEFRQLATAASQTTPLVANYGSSASRSWAMAAIAIKEAAGGGGVVNPIFATDGIHSTIFGGQVLH